MGDRLGIRDAVGTLYVVFFNIMNFPKQYIESDGKRQIVSFIYVKHYTVCKCKPQRRHHRALYEAIISFQLIYTLLLEQSKIADDEEYFTLSWRGIG